MEERARTTDEIERLHEEFKRRIIPLELCNGQTFDSLA